mgnify:CR=1 FL=1
MKPIFQLGLRAGVAIVPAAAGVATSNGWRIFMSSKECSETAAYSNPSGLAAGGEMTLLAFRLGPGISARLRRHARARGQRSGRSRAAEFGWRVRRGPAREIWLGSGCSTSCSELPGGARSSRRGPCRCR